MRAERSRPICLNVPIANSDSSLTNKRTVSYADKRENISNFQIQFLWHENICSNFKTAINKDFNH